MSGAEHKTLFFSLNVPSGISLVVQWFGLCASTSGGTGSNPGQELKSRMTCNVAKKKKKFSHLKDQTQRNGSLGIKEDGQRHFTEPDKVFQQLEITASSFRLGGWEDVLMRWLFKAQAFLLFRPPVSCRY